MARSGLFSIASARALSKDLSASLGAPALVSLSAAPSGPASRCNVMVPKMELSRTLRVAMGRDVESNPGETGFDGAADELYSNRLRSQQLIVVEPADNQRKQS